MKNGKKRLASIPFIRNIVQYTTGDADPDFTKLTSLLHWKADSAAITQGDLDAIFARHFLVTGPMKVYGVPTEPVIKLLEEEAKAALRDGDGINFENKIVLSIAIRLAAERFMGARIADAAFVAGLTSNQTPTLFRRFKERFPKETAAIDTLKRVLLMTPESIHVNSFIYEPILDRSSEPLKKLYNEVLYNAEMRSMAAGRCPG